MPTGDIHANEQEVCIIGIRKQSGEKCVIGNCFGSEGKESESFGHTLQVGNTYEFPTAWLAFKKSQNRK
jgi:hypothetical protein